MEKALLAEVPEIDPENPDKGLNPNPSLSGKVVGIEFDD